MKTNDKMWMYIGQAFDEWFDKTYPEIPKGAALRDEVRRNVVIEVRKSSAVLLRALELACEDIGIVGVE